MGRSFYPLVSPRIMKMIERDGATTRPAIEAETGATHSQAQKRSARWRCGPGSDHGTGPRTRYVATTS